MYDSTSKTATVNLTLSSQAMLRETLGLYAVSICNIGILVYTHVYQYNHLYMHTHTHTLTLPYFPALKSLLRSKFSGQHSHSVLSNSAAARALSGLGVYRFTVIQLLMQMTHVHACSTCQVYPHWRLIDLSGLLTHIQNDWRLRL